MNSLNNDLAKICNAEQAEMDKIKSVITAIEKAKNKKQKCKIILHFDGKAVRQAEISFFI